MAKAKPQKKAAKKVPKKTSKKAKSKGRQKVSAILALIHKLPQERQKYWLAQLAIIRSQGKSAELGASPATTKSKPASSSDWLLDLANMADKAYNYIANAGTKVEDKASERTLAFVNNIDSVYSTLMNEAKGIPPAIGKSLGSFVGSAASAANEGGITPYLIGAAVAAGLYAYFKRGSI